VSRRTQSSGTIRDGAAAVSLVLFGLVPIVLLPGGYSRFVVAKLLIAAVAITAAALAGRAGRLPRWLVVVLALGAAWLAVAAFASAAPAAQLVGRWPRYEGLVALPIYVGSIWAGARLLGPGSDRGRRTTILLRSQVVAVVLVAVVALFEMAGLRPLGGDVERPGSLLGNASHQGSFGVLVLGLVLPFVARRRDVWAWVGGAAAVVAVGASGSRAAMFGAAVATAVALVDLIFVTRRGGSRGALAGPVLILATLLAVVLAVPGSRARLSGADPLAQASVGGRLVLWTDTARMLADRPVLGVGPSGYVDAIARSHSPAWRMEFGTANPPDSPHSVVLQVLSAGGVPLLLLAVVVCGLAARQLSRDRRDAPAAGVPESRGTEASGLAPIIVGAVAGLCGYSVTLLFGFTTAGVTVPAMLVAGMVLARPSPPQQDERRSRGQARISVVSASHRRSAAAVAWVVIGVVWSVTLGMAAVGEVVLARATTAAANGETARANTLFHSAESLRPWDPDVALLATTAFGGGVAAGDEAQSRAAIDWSGEALERVPISAEVLTVRARAMGVVGRGAEGLAILDDLLERDPLNTEVLTSAALVSVGQGDLSSALDYFQQVTAITPDDADAWADIATLAGATGDTALEEQAAARAAELDAATGRHEGG